jgi:hypothetical protein
MRRTPLDARGIGKRAAIMHADHCIVGERLSTIKVGRPEETCDVPGDAKLCNCFSPHRLLNALPLLQVPGDTLPLPCPDILRGRTLQQ